MNKTLRDLGYIFVLFGTIIVGFNTLIAPISPLPLQEAFQKETILNIIGLIFLVQGILYSIASLLSNPY